MLVALLTSLLTSWWAVALEISWKGAVVLAAACAVSLLLRRAPAALRHAVWALALGSLLLLPALLVMLSAWRLAVIPRVALSDANTALSEVPAGVTAAHAAASQQHTAPRSSLRSTQRSTQRSRLPWRIAAFAVWMAGAGMCLLRWRNGTRQVKFPLSVAGEFALNQDYEPAQSLMARFTPEPKVTRDLSGSLGLNSNALITL